MEQEKEGMRRYAVVRILEIPYHVDKPFTYYLTPDLLDAVVVGCFVMVPFGTGNRHVMGIVLQLQSKDELPKGFHADRCKPVSRIVSAEFTLNEEMIGLCRYLKEMTFCSFGDAARAVIPTGVLRKITERYVLPEDPAARARTEEYLASFAGSSSMEADIIAAVLKKGALKRDALGEVAGDGAQKTAESLLRRGYLARSYTISDAENAVYREYLSSPLTARTLRQLAEGDVQARRIHNYRHRSEIYSRILLQLAEAAGDDAVCPEDCTPDMEALCAETGIEEAQVRTALKSLEKEGILTVRREQVFRNPYEAAAKAAPVDDNVLSAEQTEAFETLRGLYRTHEPKAALLHGVTGSGKTRVIKAMMDEVIADGRQVIMLVPEISLTPQSVSIFCAYYGDRVAVVHSGLSAGERLDVWRRARRGEVDIVIGTRSAVFAPFERLGMIVIDEEQEHTYKSDSTPKYHARDAARFRCAANKSLLLLASATPSLESYYKAEKGIYTLVKLRGRYGTAQLPEVIMADMHDTVTSSGSETPLGEVLASALAETKSKDEQAILFINRRGYHKYVSCLSCRTPVMCPHCSVPMTLHKRSGAANGFDARPRETEEGIVGGILICHYCGSQLRTPEVCPSCQGHHLHAFGYGTQRAEDDLANRFPEIRTRRMDMDTTRTRMSHELILRNFRDKRVDVLLGTQMVAKGHDFPDVTLVGVLSADALLYQDDYRASEKAFSLITQVVGRAGRGDKPGRAVIQTYNPENEILRLAAAQDYETFYRGAIRMRQAMVFPPFCEMVLLSFSSEEEVEVMNLSAQLSARIRALTGEGGEYADVQLVIFGPFEAQVYRVNEKYRMRMILKCRLNRRTRALIDTVMTEFSAAGGGRVSVSVDVNPNTL